MNNPEDEIGQASFGLDKTVINIHRIYLGILMGLNCAPLIAEPFLYCCRLQFMIKISNDPSKQYLIHTINKT